MCFVSLNKSLPFEPISLKFHNFFQICTEGSSMLPLISSPRMAQWKNIAFSQYPRQKPKSNGEKGILPVMGYALRTEQYRYIEWVSFSGPPVYKPKWNKSYGTELYDHQRDPEENWNRADDPDYKETRVMLSQKLHAGWRAAI